MIPRKATVSDLQEIRKLLDFNKLPSEDCNEHIENFIVIEENQKIIAIGGLEIYGTVGLLRSIVVDSSYRGRGISKNVFRLIEEKARGLGINKLYLLTEAAVEYFNRLGFKIEERDNIPQSIMDTKQFKELCPSSALVMSRELSGKN